MANPNERLVELYERNDAIEKELTKLGRVPRSRDIVVKRSRLLRELNQVIGEIEQIESELPEDG